MSDKPTILIKKVPYDMDILTTTISNIMKDEFEKNFKNLSPTILNNNSNIINQSQNFQVNIAKAIQAKAKTTPKNELNEPEQPSNIIPPKKFQINMAKAIQAKAKTIVEKESVNTIKQTDKITDKITNTIPNKYVQTKSRTIPIKITELIDKPKEPPQPIQITIENNTPAKFNCGFYATRKKLYALQFKESTTQ